MNMHMNHGGKRGALAPRRFVPPSCILGHWSLRCVSSRQAQPWTSFLDERRMGGSRSVQPFRGLRVSEMGFDQDIPLGTFSAPPLLWPPPGLEGVVLGIAGQVGLEKGNLPGMLGKECKEGNETPEMWA